MTPRNAEGGTGEVPTSATEASRRFSLLMLSGDVAVGRGEKTGFYETLTAFSRRFDRVDVICPRASGSAPRRIGDSVYVLPSPHHSVLQALFAMREGRRLLGERPYGLIVSHDYGIFSNGIAAWWLSRRFRVPYVSEIHHVEGYPRAATRLEAVLRRLTAAYVRFASTRAAWFRTVNDVEVPVFLQRHGVPEHKILVLPSQYVDFDTFKPMPDEPTVYDLVFVGRLASNKGIGTILQAVRLLGDNGRVVRLCIIGDGPLRRSVERTVGKLGLEDRVTMIPRVPTARDVAVLYNRAKALVCASTGEGGPRVTVEAMACGTPVISTPVGMMGELIEDGVNGLLFRWDAVELAEKIALLLDDPALRARIGGAGSASVRKFDSALTLERVASTYRALAERTALEHAL